MPNHSSARQDHGPMATITLFGRPKQRASSEFMAGHDSEASTPRSQPPQQPRGWKATKQQQHKTRMTKPKNNKMTPPDQTTAISSLAWPIPPSTLRSGAMIKMRWLSEEHHNTSPSSPIIILQSPPCEKLRTTTQRGPPTPTLISTRPPPRKPLPTPNTEQVFAPGRRGSRRRLRVPPL